MAEAKKNILLVSFDDSIAYQKYRDVFGEGLQVPNLDRFAERATTFQSAYCQAPVCGPSRTSFMTAKSPHETGVFDNADPFDTISATDAWSSRLKGGGYFVSSGGKVHHMFRPLRRRVHNVIYSDEQKRFGNDLNPPRDLERKQYGGHRKGWATTNPKDDGTFYDAKVAASAIDFLQTYDGDEPFYREVGFFSPHGPHITPARFKDLYDAGNFQQPEAWKDGFDENAYTATKFPENEFIKNGNLRWWRNSVRNYFSALSHGDYHFGQVMEALEASPHAKNTVVIVLSDHGFHLGNRNRFMKTTLWEQVANVPLMILDPDNPIRKDIHEPVPLIDIGPTVLDYAGLPPLENTVGRTLRPALAGDTDPDRAVPTFLEKNFSVRKGRHRFVQYEDGSTELFDLEADFWQLRNLGAAHAAYDEMHSVSVETCRAYGYDPSET